MSFGDTKLDLRSPSISHIAVDSFVKNLDIGEIHQIPGYSGVTRTVTALTTMIAHLNLKVKPRKENLMWFNNNPNHFVVEFSDDGAPESHEKTMTIGSLTLWNFGSCVRSREFHYPLHMITTSEKDDICSSLWMQHTDEMLLIESNIFTINDEKVTFEFQPSADQAWQCWAANVLTQSATYPSPYANVHKNDLKKIGCTIGHAKGDTWNPPTSEKRVLELHKLKLFENDLPATLSKESKYKKKLAFMADNGFRQLGEPRIGIFADRMRPEPLHLEINNWQHVLNILYMEAVRRRRYNEFIKILKTSVTDAENPGCGLKFVAQRIDEHYQKESERMKKLDNRLIGSQAISLAQFSFRLVDTLKCDNESDAQKIKRMAMSKICQYLRDIGALINRINVSSSYPENLKELCQVYFNLFSLFYPEKCQSTVWTLGYALPYHAELVYNSYKVGYGVLSMQGKESKHSSVKQELKSETNRSISEDNKGKWHQIMRSSFVRSFYLPYHFPINSPYHSHYRSRKPPLNDSFDRCNCSRPTLLNDLCDTCIDEFDIMSSVRDGKISEKVDKLLKPIECRECGEHFADLLMCDKHIALKHNGEMDMSKSDKIIPAALSVVKLKAYLGERSLSTSGTKETLRRRLEGAITIEK